MTETGCQSCLAGFKTVQRLGLTKSDLLPVKMKMHAANDQPISILGAIILRISGTDQNDNVKETRQMTYITKDSNNIFLSKAACIDLGMISKDFPTIGATPSTDNHATVLEESFRHLCPQNFPSQRQLRTAKSFKDTFSTTTNQAPLTLVSTNLSRS